MWKKKDIYTVEDHPFESFIPKNAKRLIIGTVPTHPTNFKFNFFYSGKDNSFWKILEEVFDHNFIYDKGAAAIQERMLFLSEKSIGITDMLRRCYRKNNSSVDENLFPIILTDIFSELDKHQDIEKLVLTSRGDVFGALGLLRTYFLQNNQELKELERRNDKILIGYFKRNGRIVEILVPYSPSPRLIETGITTMDELVRMYNYCLAT